MIAGVRKIMKRRVVKISLAIFVVIGILLGLLVVLLLDTGLETSFDFLDGRTMTGPIDQAHHSHIIKGEVYSFEADFNDVCAKAGAELLELGFSSKRGFDRDPRRCSYARHKSASIRQLGVMIIDKHRFSMYSTPKSSEYSSPDRYQYHYEEGWVSVEIVRTRLKYWPPQYLLRRLQLMLRRPAGTPPTKK